MKLQNETELNSKPLRALLLENIKKAGLQQKRTVRVIYSHAPVPRYSGRGRLFGTWIRVSIPKGKEFDPVRFSQVVQHELDHNRGLRHRDMIHWWDINCEWAKEFYDSLHHNDTTTPKETS